MKRPIHILTREGLTMREWKSKKRQQLKAAIRALDEYRNGCAYCPGYEKFIKIDKGLRELEMRHSVKEWGR